MREKRKDSTHVVGLQMKWVLLLGFALLWTLVVAAGTISWILRGGYNPLEAMFTRPQLVDTSVGDWVRLDGDSWMLSSWRMSKGAELHVNRQATPSGGVRIVVDDADGFSWDTVTLDLARRTDGSVEARGRVDWTTDFGPPFDGSLSNVTGSVALSSSDLAGAHPLIIDFTLRGLSGGHQVCEHGIVAAP
jgi:hypothetical protein